MIVLTPPPVAPATPTTPINGGALVASADGAGVATVAGRETHYTLNAGSLTTPLTFTGDGPCAITIDATGGGGVAVPAGVHLGGELPTGVTFVLYSHVNVADGSRTVNAYETTTNA